MLHEKIEISMFLSNNYVNVSVVIVMRTTKDVGDMVISIVSVNSLIRLNKSLSYRYRSPDCVSAKKRTQFY